MRRRRFMQIASGAALGTAAPALAGTGTLLGNRPLSVLGGRAFGSYWRAVVPGGTDLAALDDAVSSIVRDVDGALSPYRSDSELSAFNGAQSGDWRAMSPLFRTVTEAALAAAERTGGAFDPTVGPIVGRYGFGPLTGSRGDGLAAVEIGGQGIRCAGVATLDLCGIAKGHALDLIVAALDRQGIAGAMIELGGEVFARGRHPAGRHWRVGVEAPGGGSPVEALELANRAVATSGSWPQGYEIGARRYGHIVDPRTGAPATGDLASVSVIAETAMQADALATGLFALGTEAAMALAEAEALDTVMLIRDGAGWRRLTTGRTEDWLLA